MTQVSEKQLQYLPRKEEKPFHYFAWGSKLSCLWSLFAYSKPLTWAPHKQTPPKALNSNTSMCIFFFSGEKKDSWFWRSTPSVLRGKHAPVTIWTEKRHTLKNIPALVNKGPLG